MNGKPEAYERIEAYLQGRLSSDAHQQFEQAMKDDHTFAEEVALHRQVHLALADEEVMHLESLLEDIQSGRQQPFAKRLSLVGKRKWLAAATFLIIICALGYLLIPGLGSPQYASHFEPYPFYLSTRSMEEGAARKLLDEATLQYEKGHYEKALPLFETLQNDAPQIASLRFYAAYCAMETNQLQYAQAGFEEIIESGDSSFVQPAEWYLVKTLLEQGKEAPARQLLQEIASREGNFRQSAEKLLQALK
jgi:TolA-binding protein